MAENENSRKAGGKRCYVEVAVDEVRASSGLCPAFPLPSVYLTHSLALAHVACFAPHPPPPLPASPPPTCLAPSTYFPHAGVLTVLPGLRVVTLVYFSWCIKFHVFLREHYYILRGLMRTISHLISRRFSDSFSFPFFLTAPLGGSHSFFSLDKRDVML